jgi:membrane fusion protein, multidrug efflux system
VPLFNGSTRSQTIRVALANPPQSFRLGATVAVSYVKPVASQFPLPATAILSANGTSEVWIVDPKTLTVSTRPVTVGTTSDSTVAVTAGLGAGDRVVVAGVHSLKAGQTVKLDGETP